MHSQEIDTLTADARELARLRLEFFNLLDNKPTTIALPAIGESYREAEVKWLDSLAALRDEIKMLAKSGQIMPVTQGDDHGMTPTKEQMTENIKKCLEEESEWKTQP